MAIMSIMYDRLKDGETEQLSVPSMITQSSRSSSSSSSSSTSTSSSSSRSSSNKKLLSSSSSSSSSSPSSLISSSSSCISISSSLLVLWLAFVLYSFVADAAKGVVVTNIPGKATAQCNKTQVDMTVRWLFFFNDPTRILPRNVKEFDEFCDEKGRKELYVNDYARRCLPKFPRQVTSLLMYGIARKNRYYCNFTKGKADILVGARCLNAIKSLGSKCLTQTIEDMNAIRYAETEGKIAKTCCTYYRLEECLVQKTQEDHRGNCSPKDAKRMEELLEGYTGQMISNVCARYPKDVDQCAKWLSKRELTKLHKLAARKNNSANRRENGTVGHSILLPMIDILDSIPP